MLTSQPMSHCIYESLLKSPLLSSFIVSSYFLVTFYGSPICLLFFLHQNENSTIKTRFLYFLFSKDSPVITLELCQQCTLTLRKACRQVLHNLSYVYTITFTISIITNIISIIYGRRQNVSLNKILLTTTTYNSGPLWAESGIPQ